MNKHLIVLVGVSIFAIALAIVIGSRLTDEALLVTFGIALGIVLGIPVGAMAVLIGLRKEQTVGRASGIDEGSTAVVLTDQQADRLFRALDRPQASADAFTLPPRQERQFSAVGGADLSDVVDDSSYYCPSRNSICRFHIVAAPQYNSEYRKRLCLRAIFIMTMSRMRSSTMGGP